MMGYVDRLELAFERFLTKTDMSCPIAWPLIFVLSAAGICGCHSAMRPLAPANPPAQRESDWKRDLKEGRSADWVLAYLLEAGFDCRLVKNEQGDVERITAELPRSVRDDSGQKRNWRIEIAMENNRIASTTIRPLGTAR